MSFGNQHFKDQLPLSLGAKVSAASLSVVLATDYAIAVALDNGGAANDPLHVRLTDGTTNYNAPAASQLPASLGATTSAASLSIVLSSDHGALPLPMGAATESTLAAQSAKLPASLGAKTSATSLSIVLASDHGSLGTTVSNLPTTVATDTGVANASTLRSVLATRHESATTPISVRVTDGSSFGVPSATGRAYADSVRKDYSGGSVTSATWTQLIASTAATINELQIFDSSGQTLELGTGAAASETRVLIITPGFDGRVPLRIVAGTRLSIKAISATASVGELDITGLT